MLDAMLDWVQEKCSFNKCFVWGFKLLKFSQRIQSFELILSTSMLLKIDPLQVGSFKADKPTCIDIASSLKIEKIMYRSHNLESIHCLWIDQNISLDQRFLLMMKDFWRIIIWKIYFGPSTKINRCVDCCGKLSSFVYHIEPTYYIVTWCLFSLEHFCKTYSF